MIRTYDEWRHSTDIDIYDSCDVIDDAHLDDMIDEYYEFEADFGYVYRLMYNDVHQTVIAYDDAVIPF